MERLWVFVTVSMAAHFSAGINWPSFSASCARLNYPEKRALASHFLLEEKSYIKPTSWPEFTRGSYKSTNILMLMLNNANAHMLTQQQGSAPGKWIQSMSCNYQVLPTPLIIPAQAILSASTCNFPPGFLALSFAVKKCDRLPTCGRGRGVGLGKLQLPCTHPYELKLVLLPVPQPCNFSLPMSCFSTVCAVECWVRLLEKCIYFL